MKILKMKKLDDMPHKAGSYVYYEPTEGHYMVAARCTNCEAKRFLEIKKGVPLIQNPTPIECDNCGCKNLSYCDESLSWMCPLVELENWNGDRIFAIKQIYDLNQGFKKDLRRMEEALRP